MDIRLLAVLSVGAATLAVSRPPTSMEQVANLVLDLVLYSVYVLFGSFYICALKNKLQKSVVFLGAVFGFISLAFSWGFYSGQVLPDDLLTLFLTMLHVILFAAWCNKLSWRIVSLRDNWILAAKDLETKSQTSTGLAGMAGMFFVLLALPWLLDLYFAALTE